MKCTVIGIQNVNYTSKRTGQPVVGISLHCSFPDMNTRGLAVDKFFVSDNLHLDLNGIQPGDLVDVLFNNRGYVCDVCPVNA